MPRNRGGVASVVELQIFEICDNSVVRVCQKCHPGTSLSGSLKTWPGSTGKLRVGHRPGAATCAMARTRSREVSPTYAGFRLTRRADTINRRPTTDAI